MVSMLYRSPIPDIELVRTDLITYLFSNPHGAVSSAKAFIEAHTGRSLSRQEVISQTKIVACVLRRLSVQAGDVVAILSPNSIEFPLCCYATLYTGAIFSPINAALTAKDVHSQLNNSGAKVLFVHSALAQTARKAAEYTGVSHVIQLDGRELSPHCDYLLSDLQHHEVQQQQKFSRPQQRKPDDTAFICYSSGTSGTAKGVILTHGNIIANIQQWDCMYHATQPLSPITVNFLPFSHIYGLNVFICGGFFRGQTCVVIQRFTMDLFLKAIQQYRPQDLYLVPPVAIRLVRDSNLSRYDLRCVKRMMSAAAPLSADTAAKIEDGFLKAYGHQVYCHQSWGMTETSPLATAVVPSLLATHRHTVGVVVANMSFRLVDPETMLDVTATNSAEGTTQPGEILCRGPNITPGYLNNPKATAELFHTDPQTGLRWMRTGDIAVIDLKTGCFVIKDRIKEMIKYKGLQVVPSELEGLLLEHPLIEDCGVTAIYNDDIGTEMPLAFIVLKRPAHADVEKSEEENSHSIHQWLNERVANHKRLRGGIRFVQEIPKSPSGKILRRLLRTQVSSPQKQSKL